MSWEELFSFQSEFWTCVNRIELKRSLPIQKEGFFLHLAQSAREKQMHWRYNGNEVQFCRCSMWLYGLVTCTCLFMDGTHTLGQKNRGVNVIRESCHDEALLAEGTGSITAFMTRPIRPDETIQAWLKVLFHQNLTGTFSTGLFSAGTEMFLQAHGCLSEVQIDLYIY